MGAIESIELIGKINRDKSTRYDHEYCSMLCIGDDPLSTVKIHKGSEVYITYYISDVMLTKEEFVEQNLLTLIGSIKKSFNHIYGTEWTGYMWTNEEFKVGEHDLFKELCGHHNKYCYLKIYVNNPKIQYRDDIIDKLL
tara:strand:- start:3731 stop:4147 length:417 start_codon:yes stop_codon:yes gene_type:complete